MSRARDRADGDFAGKELIFDADGDTSITADTDDQIDIRIAGADDFAFKANKFEVQSGSNIDMNGTELILDADADTSITADTDDQIDFKTGGTDRMSIDSSGRIGIGLNPADYTEHSDDLVIGGSSGNKGITVVGAANGYSILSLNRSTNTSTTPNGAIEYNHTDNQMFIKANGLNSIQINSDGSVQKPLQPAFQAILGADQNNIATSNSFTTIQYNTENFDVNSDYNVSNYTFTAPVTGKYAFSALVNLNDVDDGSNYFFITLTTSNRSYYSYYGANHMDTDDRRNLQLHVLADMDASDTAYVRVLINAGNAQADVATGDAVSFFSGYLAC